MKHANIYPVAFKDFKEIVKPGNYILNYALLDDRIHLEFAVDNFVFVSQRFYSTLFEEFDNKGDNYTGSKMKLFLDMYFNTITAYRFYPTNKDIADMKTIKLYTKLVVTKSEEVKLDSNLALTEYDDKIVYTEGEEQKIIIEKVI